MSKELRINKELSIQLSKSNLRQSGSSFVTSLKPVPESQTTYQNNRRALSKDHER